MWQWRVDNHGRTRLQDSETAKNGRQIALIVTLPRVHSRECVTANVELVRMH